MNQKQLDDIAIQSDKPHHELFNRSVNEAVLDKPSIVDSTEALIEATYKKFLNNKLDDFPRMCEVARIQNKHKLLEMEQAGYKGKFTDTYGWSKDRSFHFEFEIPEDLYIFMQNMVYKKFWDDDNKKIWRAFMNAVCRGDNSMEVLMKVKSLYGSNKDVSLT